jgi:hypothetical protein
LFFLVVSKRLAFPRRAYSVPKAYEPYTAA